MNRTRNIELQKESYSQGPLYTDYVAQSQSISEFISNRHVHHNPSETVILIMFGAQSFGTSKSDCSGNQNTVILLWNGLINLRISMLNSKFRSNHDKSSLIQWSTICRTIMQNKNLMYSLRTVAFDDRGSFLR